MTKKLQNLGFILMAVILLTAVFACKRYVPEESEQKVPEQGEATGTEEVDETDNVILDQDPVTITKDVDGWKTYTNTDWGIKFRFKDEGDEVEFFNHIASITMATENDHLVYLSRDSTKDTNGDLKKYIENGGWVNVNTDAVKKLLDLEEIITNSNIKGYKATMLADTSNQGGEKDIIFTDYYFKYSKKSNDIMFEDFDYLHVQGRDEYISQILDSLELFD